MPTASLPSNVRVLSCLPEDHRNFDVSEERFTRALARAEDGHFWFRARNQLIERHLSGLGLRGGASLIELGCGGGCVAAHLSQAGYQVTGVDGHVTLVRRAALRAPGATFVVHDLSQGTGPLGGPYDAAALFDVIEHLDDPLGALAGAVALVREGGLVVGTVPALMSLWSQVDVQSGHRLRYDRAGLRSLLDRVPGASVVEVCDFNRLLVPMLWLQRRMVVKHDAATTSEENLKVPPAPVNASLLAGLKLEMALAPLLDPLPWPGASLWFALRRA